MPPAVVGDVTRLRQILLNLLSNAVKFTERGEVVLTVTSAAARRGDAELTFAVRDTGIGISAEGMSRLFQSFSQADSSTTRKYGGTGLGLAISKRLAELMGGRMWAQSDGLGKGSTFLFTIKRADRRAAAGATAEPSSACSRNWRASVCSSSTTMQPTGACSRCRPPNGACRRVRRTRPTKRSPGSRKATP